VLALDKRGGADEFRQSEGRGKMKKRLSVLLMGLLMLALSAAPALAQGQVERGPEHANSICSFSGLNDTPNDPEEGGRVQSYGQIVSQGGKDQVPSPGSACNGHRSPLK
jgi:hypothetical protein